MKLIVNRGFDRAFTHITVRLAFPASLSMTIAEMECRAPGDIFCVSPSPALLRWMTACYMIFPALFLTAFVLQKATDSCALGWLWAALAALWALPLIAMGGCQHIPSVSRRLFRATRL